MARMSLKDIDAAKAHFGAAWDIARPDGLIELIGEHHGLLQGLIEACLKSQYPDDFARIIEITYRFSYGWRRIHNPDSGEDVADDLNDHGVHHGHARLPRLDQRRNRTPHGSIAGHR